LQKCRRCGGAAPNQNNDLALKGKLANDSYPGGLPDNRRRKGEEISFKQRGGTEVGQVIFGQSKEVGGNWEGKKCLRAQRNFGA